MRIRKAPRHIVVARLRAVGVTQRVIAERAGTSQPVVSKVIGRKAWGSASAELIERVWAELERVLGANGKRAG